MPLVVVDASVVVEFVLRGDSLDGLENHLRLGRLTAPDLLDVEVVNALRKRDRLGLLDAGEGEWALDQLYAARIRRFSNRLLVPVAWELRHNVTPYDAVYVALARALNCPLVTLDRALAAAPNLGITVTVVA